MKHPERKMWCVVELRPSQNLRIRNILRAVEGLRELLPQNKLYGGSGRHRGQGVDGGSLALSLRFAGAWRG